MKLISCHIENFGCLSHYDITFHNGVTDIEKENGWGKSTLATFIRVMFYGFDNETRKSVTERERNKKSPWQKGAYGGTLTFQINDRTYRMERTFDERKAANDSFQLFDAKTNLPSSDYSSHIGEELFDIDSESFRKTVFIAQQDCMSEATDQINAKIGNLSADNADMGNYERALEDIKNEMNRITEKRVTGKGRQLKDRIAEIETEVSEKSYLVTKSKQEKAELKEKLKELEKIEDSISETDTAIQKAVKNNRAVSEARLYRSMNDELNRRAAKLTQVQSEFPGNIPVKEEVDRQLDNARQFESEMAKMESHELSKTDELSLHQFEKVFVDGVPSEELISVISANVADYETAEKTRTESSLSDIEMNELNQYSSCFSSSDIHSDKIEEMIQLWDRSEREKLLESSQKVTVQQSYDKYSVPAGICVIAAGVLFLLIKQLAAGLVLMFFGIFVIAYTVLHHKEKYEDNTEKQWAIEQNQVLSFLKNNGLETNEDQVLRNLYELKNRYEKWKSLKKIYEDYLRSEKNTDQSERKIRLKNFFSPYYGIEDNYPRLLEKLQNDIREYDALLEKKNRYDSARNNALACYKKYKDFCSFIGMNVEKDMNVHLTRVRDNLIACMEAQSEYLIKKDEVVKFEQVHDMEELKCIPRDAEETDISSLHETLNALQKQKEEIRESVNLIKREMEDTGAKLDEIAGKQSQLADMRKEYEELKKKYHVLEETSVYLINARNNFNARYLGPIKKSFEYYYSLLSNGDIKEYELDANLNISLKAYGKARTVSDMSEGYQDLIGLCRRMAMIDAMYDKEKPFILLDDPFVNLDEKKMEGAKRFIEKVSEKYQVIYLTCHPSRTITPDNH